MEKEFNLLGTEEALLLLGSQDRNLRLLRKRYGVSIIARNQRLTVAGEDAAVAEVERVVRGLLDEIRGGNLNSPSQVESAIGNGDNDAVGSNPAENSGNGHRALSCAGVELRSGGQQRYIAAIREFDIVACTGPAGTGKTFLAVCAAVEALKSGQVRKIILVRPAVEAGESLGFLPGDFHAKINPYLRPLYDALNEILDFDQVKRYLEREVIEIVPLAYMRGRTLNRAFIILDEAQNTTASQIKMFLTRMGVDSKIVVTGDVTQVDLPDGTQSGLVAMQEVLAGVEGIHFMAMGRGDIVRHPLVRRIVEAYERQG